MSATITAAEGQQAPAASPLDELARYVDQLTAFMTTALPEFQRPPSPLAISAARRWPIVNRDVPALPPGLRPKWCYGNAQRLALGRVRVKGFRGPWTYVEGYAMSTELGIPIEHAWVVDAAGRVHDFTWGGHRDCYYVGLAIERGTFAPRRNTADQLVHGRLLVDVVVAQEWR